MGLEPDIESLLSEYVSLQRSLLDALRRTGLRLEDETFNRLRGAVQSGGREWSVVGHGRGITFESGGTIVNAHVAPHVTDAVDAWRLDLYLESRGTRQARFADRLVATNERDVEAVLEALCGAGKLVRVHGGDWPPHHRLYRMVQPLPEKRTSVEGG